MAFSDLMCSFPSMTPPKRRAEWYAGYIKLYESGANCILPHIFGKDVASIIICYSVLDIDDYNYTTLHLYPGHTSYVDNFGDDNDVTLYILPKSGEMMYFYTGIHKLNRRRKLWNRFINDQNVTYWQKML